MNILTRLHMQQARDTNRRMREARQQSSQAAQTSRQATSAADTLDRGITNWPDNTPTQPFSYQDGDTHYQNRMLSRPEAQSIAQAMRQRQQAAYNRQATLAENVTQLTAEFSKATTLASEASRNAHNLSMAIIGNIGR